VWKNTAKASYIRVADVWSVIEKDPRQVFFHAVGAHHNARLSSVKRYFYRQLYPNRKKRLGIVVRQQNYYTNGCGQNCIFMMQSLEALGYPVDLLINYKEDKPKFVSESIPLSYVHLTDIRYSDYEAIIFGSEIPFAKDVAEMKRAGVRRIMFNPCNVVDAFHNENFLYSCKASSLPLLEMTYKDIADELWLTENHEASSKTYLEVINKNKIPVQVVPLVWSPLFLRSKEGTVPMNKAHTGKALDIVIMEPNIGYCKSGWLPLIVCEKLLLENPDAIHQVFLFNTPTNNPTAVGMIESLDLWKAKKLRVMTRMPITEILTFFSDPKKHGDYPVAFLSHQINLPLNYAYFDALYTGFAFVHNSHALRSMKIGHYYDDLSSGVAQLASLTTSYSAEQYTLDAQRVLQSRDPYNEECVTTFKQILEGWGATTPSEGIHVNTVTYSSIPPPVVLPICGPIESVLSTTVPPSINNVSPRVQLLVVTASETRKAILQQQFRELNVPYPIHYLEAKTLDAQAPDYAPTTATDVERRSIYSTRSHIRAVELAGLPTSPPFSLILEDDVAFHATEFVAVLTQILDSYDTCVEPHSGILSLGWIPCNNYSFYTQLANPTTLNASYTIHQRFTPGTQAYLIKRSKAAEVTPLFCHPSHKALCDVILGKKHPLITKEGQVTVFDDFGTKLLNQCILFPPLVIEQPNISLIRGTGENLYWKQFFQGHEAVRDHYWKMRPSIQSFDVRDTLVARTATHCVNRGETPEPTNLRVPLVSPLNLSDTTRPLLLSYDNKPTDTTEVFMKTLMSNAWEYVLLGKGEVWEGWHTRMNAYHKYLSTLHEDKLVVLSDARDVLCLRGPHAFREAFRSYKKDLVVSMELLCGGALDVPDTFNCVQCKPLAKYWTFHNISPRPLRKYVNNGLIAGTAKALRSLLQWSLDNKYTDDQLALGNYINTFPELVAADTGAELLHTTNFGVNAGIQSIHVQKQDSPSFAELFGRGAFFLHIPGLGGKGQLVLYNSVRKTLEEGACDKQLRSPYNYAEPAWNEVF